MAKKQELIIVNRAVDRVSRVIDKIGNSFPRMARKIQLSGAAVKRLDAKYGKLATRLKKIGRGMQSVGRTMTTFITLPLVALGVGSLKVFGDFDQGLRGVQKTTNLTGKDLVSFGETISELSTKIPVGTKELFVLAKAAGQLGVRGKDNLLKFTKVMAKLSRTTDVVGEEGAQAVAKILSLTDEGVVVVDRFGSALTVLGNNFEATERQIIRATTEITRGIGRFSSVTSRETLAIATALTALGVRAEAGGTVITKTFTKMEKAITGGGAAFVALQKVTGLSGEALKKGFKEDTVGTFLKFIQGLKKVEPEKLIKLLEDFEISGIRVSKVIPILVKKSDKLVDTLNASAKAWKENTALNKEFGIQAAGFNSEFIKVKNTFIDVLRLVGRDLAPTVKKFGKILKNIFDFLRANPAVRRLAIVLGLVLAVMGPIIFAVGSFLVLLPALTAGMAAFSAASLPITGIILLIAAGLIGLAITTAFLIDNWRDIPLFFKGVWLQIKEIFTDGVRFIINSLQNLPGPLGLLAEGLSFVTGISAGGQTEQGKIDQANINKGLLVRERIVSQQNTIAVDFKNAPRGTRVSSEGDADIQTSLGFLGEAQ